MYYFPKYDKIGGVCAFWERVTLNLYIMYLKSISEQSKPRQHRLDDAEDTNRNPYQSLQ